MYFSFDDMQMYTTFSFHAPHCNCIVNACGSFCMSLYIYSTYTYIYIILYYIYIEGGIGSTVLMWRYSSVHFATLWRCQKCCALPSQCPPYCVCWAIVWIMCWKSYKWLLLPKGTKSLSTHSLEVFSHHQSPHSNKQHCYLPRYLSVS